MGISRLEEKNNDQFYHGGGWRGEKLPSGFYEYESVVDALEKAKDGYNKTGVTDKYSTGNSILDAYLGGGIGKENGYEIVLIHSQSKMMKSTIAISILMDSLSKGVKQGWIILEGTLSETIERARRTYKKTDEFDSLFESVSSKEKNYDPQLYCMSHKMTESDYTLNNLIQWMEHVNGLGVDLFFIDPLGYAFDFSIKDANESDQWSRQSKFMQKLSRFASEHNATIVIVQHNTKDSNSKYKVFRDAAVGGSAALTKSATKVIEIRREKKKDRLQDGTEIDHLSLEMYMSRHTKSHYAHPILLDIYDRPWEFGIEIFLPMFHSADMLSAQEIANNNLSSTSGDVDRDVWYGQLKD